MKWILLTFLFEFSIASNGQQNERQQLRDCFLQAAQRKTALDSFTTKLEKIPTKSPTEEGYYGICHALRTQYTSGTWAKISLVMQSHDLLNDAILKDPNDPELRFLRITFEHFLPAFLGMSKDIPEDLKVIFKHSDFIADNPPLKKKALEFLVAAHLCSPSQNELVQQQLAELNKAGNYWVATVQ